MVTAMFGLRLVSDAPREVGAALVARAISDNLGLEVLLQVGSTISYPAEYAQWLVNETQFCSIPQKILHLDHYRSLGCRISEKSVHDSILAELRNMRFLGIDRAVIHYHHELPDHLRGKPALTPNLKKINEFAESEVAIFFIENTLLGSDPANPDFYRQMFEEVLANGLGNLGFCFDLGHAKAFSNSSLHDWLHMLDWLKDNKIPLHFHLHNNDGAADQHLSFHRADLKDLNEGDSFTNGTHYVAVVSELSQRYPGVKTLEVPADQALAELDWLQEQLHRLSKG